VNTLESTSFNGLPNFVGEGIIKISAHIMHWFYMKSQLCIDWIIFCYILFAEIHKLMITPEFVEYLSWVWTIQTFLQRIVNPFQHMITWYIGNTLLTGILILSLSFVLLLLTIRYWSITSLTRMMPFSFSEIFCMFHLFVCVRPVLTLF
jgi:hypothetical protein